MAQFTRQHAADLPAPLVGLASDNTAQFAVSVAFLAVLILVVCWQASRAALTLAPTSTGSQMWTPPSPIPFPSKRERESIGNVWPIIYALAVATLFGNGLLHLGQAVVMGGYTPGLVTAPLALAFTAFVLYRLMKIGLIKKWTLAILLIGGFALQVPLIVIALGIGKILVR